MPSQRMANYGPWAECNPPPAYVPTEKLTLDPGDQPGHRPPPFLPPLRPEMAAAWGPYWLPTTPRGLCCWLLLSSEQLGPSSQLPMMRWFGSSRGGSSVLGPGSLRQRMKVIKAACPLQPTSAPLLYSTPGINPWAGHSSSEISSRWHWAQSCPPLKTSRPGKWGRSGRLFLVTSEPIRHGSVLPLSFQSQKCFLPSPLWQRRETLGIHLSKYFLQGINHKGEEGAEEGGNLKSLRWKTRSS